MKKQILTGILISTLSFLGCENMNQPAAVDLDEQNLNIVDPETGLTEAQMRKAVDKVIAAHASETLKPFTVTANKRVAKLRTTDITHTCKRIRADIRCVTLIKATRPLRRNRPHSGR